MEQFSKFSNPPNPSNHMPMVFAHAQKAFLFHLPKKYFNFPVLVLVSTSFARQFYNCQNQKVKHILKHCMWLIPGKVLEWPLPKKTRETFWAWHRYRKIAPFWPNLGQYLYGLFEIRCTVVTTYQYIKLKLVLILYVLLKILLKSRSTEKLEVRGPKVI